MEGTQGTGQGARGVARPPRRSRCTCARPAAPRAEPVAATAGRKRRTDGAPGGGRAARGAGGADPGGVRDTRSHGARGLVPREGAQAAETGARRRA